MLGGDAAAVGERMDHRGSLLWGRYEMDCCRFVACRFWGNGTADSGGATSELEEILDNESMLEVVRCNGRGGNECRLAGVVIFSKSSVDSTPATVSIEHKGNAKGIRDLPTRCLYRRCIRWVTTLSLEFEATGDQDALPPSSLCYRVGLGAASTSKPGGYINQRWYNAGCSERKREE